MTSLALILVLASAVMHATWNLVAKGVKGGVPFVWLCSLCAALIYTPLVLGSLFIQKPHLTWMSFVFMALSAALHAGYFVMLQRGYRTSDISVIYPLARGTGPVVVVVVAVSLFQERPTPLALGGIALIVCGVFILAGGLTIWRQGTRQVARQGVFIGVLIAGYTLVDKHAVSTLLIPPLLLDFAANTGRMLLLTPYVLKHWPAARFHWKNHRKSVLAVAVLSPLAYICVLSALTFSPVSYIAPAREVSILIGVVVGARLYQEKHTPERFGAALLILLGLVALALG